MEDDMRVKMTNGTLKILICLDGVVNWDGVLKSSGKLEGDHAMHFWGWIEKCITQIWSKNVHMHVIQFKGDLWCECHLQWMEIDKKDND